MIDDRRREAQRLCRSQELADEMRDRQSELRLELREDAERRRAEPIFLAEYRARGARDSVQPIPEDIC